MLDMGVVIPELAKYGGAERVLIECIARWQDKHRITLYASKFNADLLKEHGIKTRVKCVKLRPYFEGEHSIVLNCILLPKLWEMEIGDHEVYHTHLWPTHLIDLHPSVWYPHEPLRVLGDLRYSQPLENLMGTMVRNVQMYPKQSYDRVAEGLYEAYLNAMTQYDKLGKPDRVVANSKHTAAYVERVYGMKVADVVYPGVSVGDFMHMPSDENAVLTIGQLWAHKRVRLIIEAVQSVETVQLYVVGTGPEKKKLQTMARVLGLQDRVFFLENLTNHELQILLSRCMAVVFAAHDEPFGIVPVEALAAGKPLIAVNEGGYTEVVDESCAILVPPTPGDIAQAIRYLVENKEVAREMGNAGIEVAKRLSWDNTADEIVKIIEDTHQQWQAARAPSKQPLHVETLLFGIQYFCWYGEGAGAPHWNDNMHSGAVTDMPSMGYYASSDGTTITQHLEALAKIGVDFVILNLHIDGQGISLYERATINRVFEIAEALGSSLRFAVQLCFYNFRRDHTASALHIVRREFARRPSYLHIDGKPVLFTFWPGVQDGKRHWLDLYRKHGEGCLHIASSLRMYPPRNEKRRTFDTFDGFSLFSPLEITDPAHWEDVWTEAYSYRNAGRLGLPIITVSPGYDDTHLTDPRRMGNPHRCVDRRNGEIYRRMIRFALSVDEKPGMVIVSTFNEYHENTHIEASRNFGSKYMDMTKELIRTGKDKWS